MMATILILFIMAGCAAIMFLKGSFIKAFATFMSTLCAAIVAFGWYESLANMIIRQELMTDWSQMVSFIILFAVAFIIFEVLSILLLKNPIDLGVMPERVGRIAFGIFAGIIISGCVLTAIAMAPLSGDYPYQRFDARPDIQKPHGALLNPDGFISKWFSIISKGSLGGSKSFAVLHSGLIDQLHLNRTVKGNIKTLADTGSIDIPKAAAWPAPEGLKDNTGAAVSVKSDRQIIIVRVGFTTRALKASGVFTTGQLRLICKQKGDKQRLQGSAEALYPLGYMKSYSQLQPKGLADQIQISNQNIKDGSCPIDFAFEIPSDFEPVAVEFKANLIAEVGPMVASEQAPKTVAFIQTNNCASGLAKVTPAASAKIYGIELAGGPQFLQGSKLSVSDQGMWNNMQSPQSLSPARFEGDQIVCVESQLSEPNQPVQENKISQIFKPASNYSLLSLKCNNPAAHSTAAGDQLPVIIDSAGAMHHACGIIAAGKIEGKNTIEADFCPEKIILNEGIVSKAFPDTVWLTEKADSISEFYVLYMIKTGTILMSVQPAGAQTGAIFESSECFTVN